MITLVSVLESWRERYGLSDYQWLELAEQVSLTVDLVDHVYPPMSVDLADRLGVRRFQEAVSRVLHERLGGGVPGVTYGLTTMPHQVEEANEAIERMAEENPPAPRYGRKRIMHCSSCGEQGHYRRTCRRFPLG